MRAVLFLSLLFTHLFVVVIVVVVVVVGNQKEKRKKCKYFLFPARHPLITTN